VFQLDVVFLVF